MTEDIYTVLRGMLDGDRYRHSIGVQQTAADLARLYGGDIAKASMAGLVHDCAKGLSGQELLEQASEWGVEINDVYRVQPGLLHGPVGAFICRKMFDIYDGEILHSISCHTTGCAHMSVLDKIIYIADYIEPNRIFPGVEKIRELAFRDLNKGMLSALENTIMYVIKKGELIDMQTIEARNSIIMESMDCM
jgi:predicted HD superfamily hydrolase involved in NAD metabolism